MHKKLSFLCLESVPKVALFRKAWGKNIRCMCKLAIVSLWTLGTFARSFKTLVAFGNILNISVTFFTHQKTLEAWKWRLFMHFLQKVICDTCAFIQSSLFRTCITIYYFKSLTPIFLEPTNIYVIWTSQFEMFWIVLNF